MNVYKINIWMKNFQLEQKNFSLNEIVIQLEPHTYAARVWCSNWMIYMEVQGGFFDNLGFLKGFYEKDKIAISQSVGQKTKGTLLSQTFKVEENKVTLFFLFMA